MNIIFCKSICVNDIYIATKAEVERGYNLFSEYLYEYNVEDLFKEALKIS